MTSILLAIALAQRPPPKPPPPVPPPIYWNVNVVADPGFESPKLAPAWSTAGSYLDPTDEGDPDDFEGVPNGRSVSIAHTGSASFSFGTYPGQGPAHVHSVVFQALSPTPLTSQVTEASLYAWSPASPLAPVTLNVQVDYADGSHSYDQASVSGSDHDQSAAKGWRYFSFKSALRVGATVSGIEVYYDAPPFGQQPLWVDDVSIVARYQVHPR